MTSLLLFIYPNPEMLYVHIPYCHRKCTYCAFYSIAGRHDTEEYVKALCREIEWRSNGKSLSTVYFGGGTPTQLPSGLLERIVDTIRRCFDLSQLKEATIEANPEDLTPEYLDSLVKLDFFNRVSIGIQSFSDSELHLLNRVHNAGQAYDAVRRAADAGFANVSVDLIMGLPGQTATDWVSNLDTVDSPELSGVVKHLSCYELTVEPGSILERQIALGRVTMPPDETLAEQYAVLQEWCHRHGFEQYEVSNFCRPGFRSIHNSRYWNRTPYIGVGAAAHSFDGRRRRWNTADAALYIGESLLGRVPFDEEQLSDKDAYNEYVMTALRTSEGILKSFVDDCFREHLSNHIAPFVSAGLVLDTDTAYCPTPVGMLHADGIAADLFV